MKGVVVAAVTAGLVACSSGQDQGSIVGRGNPCTGPSAPPADYVLPVTVTRYGEALETRRVEGPTYDFEFRVQPGSYRLSAPGDRPVTVSVRQGQRVRVELAASCL